MPSRYIEIEVIKPDGDLHVAFRASGEFHEFEETTPLDFVMVNPVSAVSPGKEIESDRLPVSKAL